MRSLFVLITFFVVSPAYAQLCNPAQQLCGFVKGQRSSGTPAKPSQSNTIRLNPSAVPTDKAMGIEGIYFKGEVDVSLAKGLGRVGAAISPSNSEETFFGPPGFETNQEFYDRKFEATKFPNKKVTLATAVNLIEGKGSGLKKFSLNLGVMGKYHKPNALVTGGGGLMATIGPMSFGYSGYRDQAHITDNAPGEPEAWQHYDYNVETFSAGIFLKSVAIDYSVLHIYFPGDRSQIKLLTGSLFLKQGIFTIASRVEESFRPMYDYSTNQLKTEGTKNDVFFAAQLTAGSHFMIGAFYNYYMLREVSVAATLFF